MDVLVSDDQFKVGLDLEMKVDIKPRTVTGIILAVHSKGDYMVLQIVDGEVCQNTKYVKIHGHNEHFLLQQCPITQIHLLQTL